MQNRSNHRRAPQPKGFALITALLITAVTTIFITSVQTQAMMTKLSADMMTTLQRADLLAEAAIDYVFYPPKLQAYISTLTTNLSNGNPADDQIVYDDNDDPLTGYIGLHYNLMLIFVTRDADGRDLWRLVTKSPAMSGGANKRIIEARVLTRNISNFAMLSGNEVLPTGDPVVWTSQDQMHGNVHTNNRFTLSGNPTFDNGEFASVNSSLDLKYDCIGTCNPTITNGIYNATPKRLPTAEMAEEWVKNKTFVLTGDTTVTVIFDDAPGVNRTKIHVDNDTMSPPVHEDVWLDDPVGMPTNPYGNPQIATRNGNLTIQGEKGALNGQLSVWAIDGDVIVPKSLHLGRCDPLDPSPGLCQKGDEDDDRITVGAIRGNVKFNETAATSEAIAVSALAWADPNDPETTGYIQVAQKGMEPAMATFTFLGVSLAENGWEIVGSGAYRRRTDFTQDLWYSRSDINYGSPFIVYQTLSYVGDYSTGP